MAAARYFAAVVLILLASAVAAQNVVITVTDQSGSVVSGAHVSIIGLPGLANDSDWFQYALHSSAQASVETNNAGEAIVDLAKGNYAISVGATGFKLLFKRIEIQDRPSQAIQATLLISNSGCGVCVVPGVTIPLEPLPGPDIFIPLEPLQTISVPNSRVRRERRRI
jgi:hypothetical protein